MERLESSSQLYEIAKDTYNSANEQIYSPITNWFLEDLARIPLVISFVALVGAGAYMMFWGREKKTENKLERKTNKNTTKFKNNNFL